MLKYIVFLTINASLIISAYSWFKTNIQLDIFMKNISSINVLAIFASSLPYILLLVSYGLRTKIILKQSFLRSFSINIIGHGLNSICPLRLGEILKIIFAKRFFSISMYELGLATIIEKCLDLICLSCLGLVYVSLTNNMNNLGLLIGLFFVSIIIIYLFKKRLYVNNPFWKKTHFDEYIRKVVGAIEYCDIDKNLVSIFSSSIIIWILTILNFDFYFRIQLLNLNFSIIDSIFMVLITALSFAIPLSFGNFGLFEGAVVYYLQAKFHLTAEYSLALALILHISIVLPQLIGMLFNVLYKEGRMFYTYINSRSVRLRSA